MLDIVQQRIQESIGLKKVVLESELTGTIVSVAESIIHAYHSDNKLLLCGNGGSAADAQHISAELVNRFNLNRKPLPAIALTTDASIITSIANDFSYDEIFVKQVEAIGRKGDVLIGISTSGTSKNVLKAVERAKNSGLLTIGFTGTSPNPLAELSDISFAVQSKSVARIQEIHIMALHIICELVETKLFG